MYMCLGWVRPRKKCGDISTSTAIGLAPPAAAAAAAANRLEIEQELEVNVNKFSFRVSSAKLNHPVWSLASFLAPCIHT